MAQGLFSHRDELHTPWHRSGAIWHLGLLLINFPAEPRTKAPESGNRWWCTHSLILTTPNWQHLLVKSISSNIAKGRILKQQSQTVPESRDDSRKQIPQGTPRSSSHPFCHALLWQYSPPSCTMSFLSSYNYAELSPNWVQDSLTTVTSLPLTNP